MYILNEQNEKGEWVTIAITTRKKDAIALLGSSEKVDKKPVDITTESVYTNYIK